MHLTGFTARKSLLSSLVVIFAVAFGSNVFGQFTSLDKFKQRRDKAVAADEERQKAERGEGTTAKKVPVMNVDVQMVLSPGEYPNFLAAKPNPALKIADGEPLWMYVRFNGKLGDYVGEPETGEDGKPRYRLFAEIGPRGDITSLNRFVIVFREEDLALNELKINLSPGLKGRNASIPILLDRAVASNPGVWQNELRLSNTMMEPRAITENLANAPITFDFSKGTASFKRIHSDYDSLVIFGGAAASAPANGRFENEKLKTDVANEMKSRSMQLIDLRFVSDDWLESYSLMPARSRSRAVLGYITYSTEGKCFTGTARIRETFDDVAGKFGRAETDIKDYKPTTCAN